MNLNLDCFNAWQCNAKPAAEMDVGLQQLLDQFACLTQQFVSVRSRNATSTSSECCKLTKSLETQKSFHVVQKGQRSDKRKP